jgi:hypothetical protein
VSDVEHDTVITYKVRRDARRTNLGDIMQRMGMEALYRCRRMTKSSVATRSTRICYTGWRNPCTGHIAI